MNEIWRKLRVSILDSPAFANPEHLKVYIYCLSKTSHKTAFVTLPKGRGRSTITVQPGQMIWGRNKAAADLNFNPSKCERILKGLEKKGMVLRQPHKNFTLVSVLELIESEDIIKESELQMNFKRTSNELQVNTSKSIKSIKENKREAPAPEEDQTNQYTGGGSIAIEYQVKSLFIQAGAVCLDSDIRHCKTIAYAMRDIIKQSKPNGGRPSNDQIKEGIKAVFDNLPDWVKDKGFFSPSGIARNISGIVNEIRANKAAKLKDNAKNVSIHYSPAKRPKKQP